MVHHLAALHGSVDEFSVGHTADQDFSSEFLQLVEKKPGLIVKRYDLVASLQQTPGEMAAGESGASGDQTLHSLTSLTACFFACEDARGLFMVAFTINM
jgi:hypothetical protein